MKRNLQLENDAIINNLGGERRSLLLQCCCGPCSTAVLEYLSSHFDIRLLFYNPNIQPFEEYEKRLFWLREVAKRYPALSILECDYEGERFESAARGLEELPEGGARCTECFKLRLSETARRARQGNYDFFGTTLTVSPHKDAQRINAIGFELEEQYGVRWLTSDFKKREGYKRSIELSREYGLYRQEYCGCLFSKVLQKSEE